MVAACGGGGEGMVTIRKEKERDTRSHAGLSFEKSPLKSSMVPSTVPTSTIGWLNLQHATHTDVQYTHRVIH